MPEEFPFQEPTPEEVKAVAMEDFDALHRKIAETPEGKALLAQIAKESVEGFIDHIEELIATIPIGLDRAGIFERAQILAANPDTQSAFIHLAGTVLNRPEREWKTADVEELIEAVTTTYSTPGRFRNALTTLFLPDQLPDEKLPALENALDYLEGILLLLYRERYDATELYDTALRSYGSK